MFYIVHYKEPYIVFSTLGQTLSCDAKPIIFVIIFFSLSFR